MEINVNLSKKSIEEAIRELKRLKKNLENNIDSSNEQLALLGEDYLKKELSGIGTIDGNEIGEVKESVVIGENARLTWSGSQITFIEYGTGSVGKGTYNGDLPSDYAYETGRVIQRHKKNKNDPYWRYKTKDGGLSEKTYGITAQAPMLHTSYFMRNNIGKVYGKILSNGGSNNEKH